MKILWLSALSVFVVDRIGLTTGQFCLLITIRGAIVIVFQYPVARRIEWYFNSSLPGRVIAWSSLADRRATSSLKDF